MRARLVAVLVAAAVLGGGALLLAGDDPERVKSCTAEGWIQANGEILTRSLEHDCQFVDDRGNVVTTGSGGPPASDAAAVSDGRDGGEPGAGCPAFPAVPDADCTGWRHTGVSLTPYTGPMTITRDGTVIDGKAVTGTLTIDAKDVTIQRSRIRGTVVAGWDESKDLLLEDCEIDGTGGINVKGVQGGGYTVNRCDIHHVAQGVDMGGGNVTVRDSYIHDLYATGGFHSEPVLSNGGGPYTLVHNNLVADFAGGTGAMSGALGMYGDLAPIHDVLVQNNRFAATTATTCVYGGSSPGKPYPLAADVRFIDNIFAGLQPSCGSEVPVHDFASGNGNEFSGNVLRFEPFRER